MKKPTAVKAFKLRSLLATRFIILADILLVFLLAFGLYTTFKTDINQLLEEEKAGFSQEQVQGSAKMIHGVCANDVVEACYKKQFDQLVRATSLEYGQQTLWALQNYDEQLRHCHVLSHAVGNSALRKDPGNWKGLLAVADVDTCGGGFFHGIIEAHVADDPTFKINKDSIHDICNNPENGFRERTCNHIMGHLALFGTDG
ncbi:MAG: hypothetical protein WD988_03425, partial [Candidatus Curtissbacteria bacterium]